MPLVIGWTLLSGYEKSAELVLTLGRLSLQLRVKRLLHRNEEGIQINMEDTASHETIYELAQRADKAYSQLDR